MPEQHDDEVFDGLDAPRHMPPGLRGRVETGLLGGGHERSPTEGLLADIDAPRPLPALARARIERTLLWHAKPAARPVPRVRSPRRWFIAAAISALVLPVTVVREVPMWYVVEDGGESSAEDAMDLNAEVDTGPAAAGDGGPPPFAYMSDGTAFAPLRSLRSRGVPPASTPTSLPAPVPAAPQFTIAVHGGNAEAELGLNAYVALLNSRGGVRGRLFSVVPEGRPADITVNLSDTPLPADAPGPVIESWLAPDRVLRGDAFGLVGAIDRQARLLVEDVYPTESSSRAVIYRETTGVLHDEVPAALEAALAEKGVDVRIVDVVPGRAVRRVAGDAVFLSLEAAAARRVLSAYGTALPLLGFNGVATVADTDMLRSLPPGTRIASPFVYSDTYQLDTLRAYGATGTVTARHLYGWTAGKALASALWRNMEEGVGIAALLPHLGRYNEGLGGPHVYREGTNSVQSEAVILTVLADGTVDAVGGFRTDTRG